MQDRLVMMKDPSIALKVTRGICNFKEGEYTIFLDILLLEKRLYAEGAYK